MITAYLISEDYIKSNSLISQNVDGKYLQSAIGEAQDIYLQSLIGTSLYNRLQNDIDNDALTDDYKLLLDDYITPYLLQKVQATIQLAIFAKFKNSGVIQSTDQQTTYTSLKDVQYIINQFNVKAEFYAERLKKYLCENSSKYKEWSYCKDKRKSDNIQTVGIKL